MEKIAKETKRTTDREFKVCLTSFTRMYSDFNGAGGGGGGALVKILDRGACVIFCSLKFDKMLPFWVAQN